MNFPTKSATRCTLVGLWLLGYGWTAHGQTLTREQLTGTWLGVHVAYDMGYWCPLPTYIRLNADGTSVTGLVDEAAPPQRSTWSITDGQLQIDTNRYARGQVILVGDRLRINGYFPLQFRRYVETPLDLAQVERTLTNQVWVIDSLDGGPRRLHLHGNRQACLEDPATGHKARHYWSLTAHGRSVFLTVKGNGLDSTAKYRFMFQVSRATDGQVAATGWNGHAVTTQNLRNVARLPASDTCRVVGFQPCRTCLYQPLDMYYQFDRKGHSERLWHIRETYRKAYRPVNITGQSGLVRIRFLVNCAGEAGQYDVLELDANYQKRPFDRRITDQLLTICRMQLSSGWLPGSDGRSEGTYDYVQFITLRLRDGVITEIFP